MLWMNSTAKVSGQFFVVFVCSHIFNANLQLKSLFSNGRIPWVTLVDTYAIFRTPCLFSGKITRSHKVATLTTRLSPSCWQPSVFCVNKQDVPVSAIVYLDSHFCWPCLFVFFVYSQIWWNLHFICVPTNLLSRRWTPLGASYWTRLMHRYKPHLLSLLRAEPAWLLCFCVFIVGLPVWLIT